MWDQVWLAIQTAAGILWKALWALSFGYLISSAIQVLVTRKQMAKLLGEDGIRQQGLSTFFGFVSSSCSFAALATARTLHVKGAHAVNAMAFLIASTNLVIELGIVLWLLLGWQFFLANLLLGLLMVAYAFAITRVWFPKSLAGQAREHAERQMNDSQGHDHHDHAGDGDAMSWWQKLTSYAGLKQIADAFFMEWKMVWKEILFGFLVAGFISVFVPQAFWNALFLAGGDEPSVWVVIENALIAPIVAFFTFIGSMGNVPLAAMLWGKNASFGGVMSFLGADLVAATVLYIQAKYYGWKYALYLAAVLYASMVAAGISVHYIFALIGIIPQDRPGLGEMVRFAIDYTFWLNLLFLAIGGAMVWLHLRGAGTDSHDSHEQHDHESRESDNAAAAHGNAAN